MMKTKMKFYNEVDETLKHYIKCYWTAIGELDSSEPHKILPMDHMDIIVPLKGKYFHVEGEKLIQNPDILFHGIHTFAFEIVQREYVESFGISFRPWGAYSLIHAPLDRFKDRYMCLNSVNKEIANELLETLAHDFDIKSDQSVVAKIKELEAVLCQNILGYEIDPETIAIIDEAIKMKAQPIGNICETLGVSARQLERLFNKYVGTNPKNYFRICQFEEASRQVIYNDKPLTEIAYDAAYSDQAHFSNTFKNYSKTSPSGIRRKGTALKTKFDFE